MKSTIARWLSNQFILSIVYNIWAVLFFVSNRPCCEPCLDPDDCAPCVGTRQIYICVISVIVNFIFFRSFCRHVSEGLQKQKLFISFLIVDVVAIFAFFYFGLDYRFYSLPGMNYFQYTVLIGTWVLNVLFLYGIVLSVFLREKSRHIRR